MDPLLLQRARTGLIRTGLIAYEKPLYQVLALDENPSSLPGHTPGLQSLGQIFKHLGKEAL